MKAISATSMSQQATQHSLLEHVSEHDCGKCVLVLPASKTVGSINGCISKERVSVDSKCMDSYYIHAIIILKLNVHVGLCVRV